MTFSNEQIQMNDLPDWESVNFQPISKRYLTVIIINYIIVWMIIIVVAGIIIYNTQDITITNGIIACASITLFFVILVMLSTLAFKKRGYAIREHDVLYKAGLLGFHTTIIPYKHIQHVKVKESLIARMFKLVTLDMYTSGAGKNLMINGLERVEAEKLQQFIMNKISQESAVD